MNTNSSRNADGSLLTPEKRPVQLSPDVVLHASGLSKRYDIYQSASDMLVEKVTRNKRHKEFWALRDVSFDVRRGEILGIIGRNGAGKSTLLKLVTGTLDRTSGELAVRGKVAAILELGTGFHPEYTGRENIIMGGLCLGLTRKEIEDRLYSIIEFSELEEFIDQPFKTYSSGMQARLTFSTALSVDPDILIVDEALAVGDVLFQEKCMRRMREFCDSGKTILFVTHSLQYIYEFCTRCILLANSTIAADGPPNLVGEAYERLLASDRNKQNKSLPVISVQTDQYSQAVAVEDETSEVGFQSEYIPPMPDLSSVTRDENVIPQLSGGGRIEELWVESEAGVPTERMLFGRRYRVVVQVAFDMNVPRPNIGFKIQRDTGVAVLGDTLVEKGTVIPARKGTRLRAHFEFECRLAAGTYLLGGGVTSVYDSGNFDLLDLVRGARVLTVEGPRTNALVDPASKIWVTKLASDNKLGNG